ncbi:hypothetical protein Fmac_032693 [Flemingia macrophylla]|uniref:Uncharacterized protein n=1 Tax=Flemingia macrophylla TaxID=520843 RepID=A0ABD1L5M1_9FABA
MSFSTSLGTSSSSTSAPPYYVALEVLLSRDYDEKVVLLLGGILGFLQESSQRLSTEQALSMFLNLLASLFFSLSKFARLYPHPNILTVEKKHIKDDSGAVLPIKIHRDDDSGQILNLMFVWVEDREKPFGCP